MIFSDLNLTDVEVGYKLFKRHLFEKIDIKENDIAKDEKPFIDLFRSCLYPNFARSLESLSTLDWDMT